MSAEILYPELIGNFESENFWTGEFRRVNDFLSNPGIFPPAIFWVCDKYY